MLRLNKLQGELLNAVANISDAVATGDERVEEMLKETDKFYFNWQDADTTEESVANYAALCFILDFWAIYFSSGIDKAYEIYQEEVRR